MRTSSLFAVMARIDALWEQPPMEAFDQLVRQELPWSHLLHDEVSRAAWHILAGLWLFYLGNWCPDETGSISWHGTIFTGSDDDPLGLQLMLAGIALRTTGCREAALSATPESLAPLRKRHVASNSSQLSRFQEVTLEWMLLLYQHHQDEQDWYGTPLPTTVEMLSVLFHASNPARTQGNTSIVTPITFGRQAYFIKRLIEPGALLTLYEGFHNECATTALLNALPWRVGPHTGCLYMSDDGTLSYLSSKVNGVNMRDIRKAASRVSLASVQAAVLAEFVGCLRDRHDGNIFIDRFHAQPWLIDFAPALDAEIEPLVFPNAADPPEEQREAFTSALWLWHPDCLKTATGETIILDDVLWEMSQARQAVLLAIAPFAVPEAAQAAIAHRFDLLSRLAQAPGEKTVESLNRLIAP